MGTTGIPLSSRAASHTRRRPPRADDALVVASPWGHRVMFVLLVLMAAALYAPAVLTPILAEHATVLAEERQLAEQVADQQRQLDTVRQLIDAFEHDPIVNERLALLDLKYQRPGEEIVPVPLESEPHLATTRPAAIVDSADLELVPPTWPGWAREAESWARRNHLLRLFLSQTVRVVLLLMAGGLLVAAVVLYPPQSRRALTGD